MNDSRDESRRGHPRGGRGPRGIRLGEGREGRGGGGRGGRAGFRLRRGDIRGLLLAGLIDGPAHGYELMRRLEEQSDGRWRPSPGSVYPMLQQLEDEALVHSSEQDGRKVYDLTDTGRAEADPAKLAALTGDGAMTDANDLRGELEQLHLAVRQIRAVGSEAQIEEAAAALRQARQSIYRILAES